MKQENQRPLTVEDLLRLKQAERPSRDFWARFDEELRTKQLVALVRREPWWQRLPSWTLLFRYRFAMGAAAVLALSFVTVRQFRGPAPVSGPVVVASAEKAAVEINIVPTVPAFADAAVLPAFNVGPAEVAEPAFLEPVEESKPAVNRPHLVSLLNSSNAPELLALATSEMAPGAGRNLFGLSSGFETRALPARASGADPSEPLAAMRHPMEERRIALARATMYAINGQIESPSRLVMPVTSKLSYDGVDKEQPGRLQVGNDKASLNASLRF